MGEQFPFPSFGELRVAAEGLSFADDVVSVAFAELRSLPIATVATAVLLVPLAGEELLPLLTKSLSAGTALAATLTA